MVTLGLQSLLKDEMLEPYFWGTQTPGHSEVPRRLPGGNGGQRKKAEGIVKARSRKYRIRGQQQAKPVPVGLAFRIVQIPV